MLLIRKYIGQCPELYLDELSEWIEFQTGQHFPVPTLSKCLRRMGLSVAKVSHQILFIKIMCYLILLSKSLPVLASGHC